MTATILVVDDLEPNVKLLEAKLLSEYYTVFTANSGKTALKVLAQEKIDVILLDVMMPEMDGFETCRLIKSNPETTHIPVVMVTALTDVEDRVKGLEAGADEFLTKPVNDTALLARVRSLSRMKTILDELKLRNQTSRELGESVIELNDNFNDSQILLIDDDIIQAKNLTRSLLKLTPNIRVAEDIEDFSFINESYVPDVIIISCQLETGDPLRIAVSLRAKNILRYCSFVLMTDEDDMSKVIKGMERVGVNDYFHYPVDENELIARIKIQLRRKKYQNSLHNDLEQSVNLAVKDGLTGIYNRRYFDLHINHLIKNTEESNRPLALMMLDIDHFKKVNDTYGHQAGDVVIKDVANILKQKLRITDIVARYGGEEFVAAVYDVTPEVATDIAERIRHTVEEYEFNISNLDQPLKNTISIGVAIYSPGQNPEQLIESADKALYAAKESGRNQVKIYG